MIGTKLAHYEITAKLGEGGMGAVYRAHDAKLDREVALKLLPAELSGDSERLARFRREAKVLASLNHPNIAGIYGLEEASGQSFLVMELAEGEDLAARLKRGLVSVSEAIEIAGQIAQGLEEAHEKGIVHRDLKPANVMVSAQGKVKLLDFGLARAYAGDSVDEGNLEHSPTITAAMTQAGVILGTAAYMSPEQAKGRPVDRRADIWSFGVVLFEMLTGTSLFAAETISESLASVLMQPIDWTLLPADVPPVLRALLERCLERDPHKRLRDIGEARIHLQDPTASSVLSSSMSALTPSVVPAAGQQRRWLPWTLLAAVSIALAVVLLRGGPPSVAPARLVQSQLEAPPGTGFHLAGTNPAPAMVSPDGKYIVFGARGENAAQSLWLQDLSLPQARELAGTNGAQYQFWSNDGTAIGFFTDGGLHVLELASETVREVASASDGKGGCWMPGGRVLFTVSSNAAISQLDLATGEVTEITELTDAPAANSHRLPRRLSDDTFLYAARLAEAGPGSPVAILAQRLDGSPARELVRAEGQAEYANGHLLYVNEANLIARPLDPQTLEFTGPPVTVATEVGLVPGAALALFSTSDTGALVYHPGYRTTLSAKLAWFELDGSRLGEPIVLGGLGNFDLSPDDRTLALELWGDRSGLADLWLYDFASAVPTRLTFETASEQSPQWSPDGKTLYYMRSDGDASAIVALEPNSQAEPRVVLDVPGLGSLDDVSPDGSLLCFTVNDSTTSSTRIYIAPVDGSSQPVPVDDGKAPAYFGRFSPDGRWISYASMQGEKWTIVLKTNPPTSRKWQVTDRPALWHQWAPDGSRVYFQWASNELSETEIDLSGPTPRIGQTSVAVQDFPNPVTELHDFAVSSDGQRVAVTDATGADDARPLQLVMGWPQLLQRGRDRR